MLKTFDSQQYILAILAIPWIFLKRHHDVGSICVLFFYVDDSAATERTGNELVDINVYVEIRKRE